MGWRGRTIQERSRSDYESGSKSPQSSLDNTCDDVLVEEKFTGFEGTNNPPSGVGIEGAVLNCSGKEGEILDTGNGEVAGMGFGGEEYIL